MKHFLPLFLALFLLPVAADAAYSVVSTSSTTPATGLQRTEYVVQDGSDTRQRFTLTRVVNTTGITSHGAIYLLPGSSANFEIHEVPDTGSGYSTTLAARLANAGVDVWGYSPRSKQIPANACTTGAFDCTITTAWGFDTIVADALYARSLIAAQHGGASPVIGGWSLGAVTTYAVLNASPTSWAGAWLYEGVIKTSDTLTQTLDITGCLQGQALVALGQAGGQTIGAFLTVSGLPEPLRRTTLVAATTVPLQPPTAFTRNYQLLAPAINLLGLTYDWAFTDYNRLNGMFAAFNNYESAAVNRDLFCSLSGSTTAFNANLGSYTAPVLALEAGKGMGAWMGDSLAALGTPGGSRTVIYSADRAHGDHYAAADHATYVENPLIAFLTSIFP